MRFYEALECTAVEPFVGLNDLEHLTSRQYLAELGVVLLLYFFHLKVKLIHFLDGIERSLVVIGIDKTNESHFIEQLALLLLHLFKQRKELCTLIGRQTCLLDNELLQVFLKLLRIESAWWLTGSMQ